MNEKQYRVLRLYAQCLLKRDFFKKMLEAETSTRGKEVFKRNLLSEEKLLKRFERKIHADPLLEKTYRHFLPLFIQMAKKENELRLTLLGTFKDTVLTALAVLETEEIGEDEYPSAENPELHRQWMRMREGWESQDLKGTLEALHEVLSLISEDILNTNFSSVAPIFPVE